MMIRNSYHSLLEIFNILIHLQEKWACLPLKGPRSYRVILKTIIEIVQTATLFNKQASG